MDQEVPIIHQNPIRLFVPFRADREFTECFELAVNLVADGLPLPGIACGTDYKEVGERGDVPEVEHAKVGGFFRFGREDGSGPVAACVFGRREGWQRSARLNCRKALLRLAYYIPRRRGNV